MMAGILLAAGRGTRFGADKRLHDVGGHPLIHYALTAALGSRITPLYIVVGPDDTAVTTAIESQLTPAVHAHFVENDNPSRGMMSSLKAALKEMPSDCEAVMVIHADMPLVPSTLIDRLVDEFEQHGGFVLPECRALWQHPRVIPHWAFAEFLALGDDDRGTAVLGKHRNRITRVPVQDDDWFIDVDLPEDLETVERLLTERRNP